MRRFIQRFLKKYQRGKVIVRTRHYNFMEKLWIIKVEKIMYQRWKNLIKTLKNQKSFNRSLLINFALWNFEFSSNLANQKLMVTRQNICFHYPRQSHLLLVDSSNYQIKYSDSLSWIVSITTIFLLVIFLLFPILSQTWSHDYMYQWI